MTYVEFLNQRFKSFCTGQDRVVIYGQNVSTGSCLSGLSRGFDKTPGCTVLNTTNAENTLVGMGFGLMLRGVSSIFFMKQQDFLLLGIDQLVNTWNALRHRDIRASFTVVAIVVDTGWEGPQSCLNNLADYASIARIPAFTPTTAAEIEHLAGVEMPRPGVRLVGVSQRLFRQPVDASAGRPAVTDGSVFSYAEGPAATIAAFNLAFPQAKAVHETLAAGGHAATLFSVPGALEPDYTPILADLARTGRLVVVDDGKGVNTPAQRLIALARAACPGLTVVQAGRQWSPDWAVPNADIMPFDPAGVAAAALGNQS